MTRSLGIVALVGALICAVVWLKPADIVRSLPTPEVQSAAADAGVLVVDLVDGASTQDLADINAIVNASLAWTHPLAVDEALAQGKVANLQEAISALDGHPLVEFAEPLIELKMLGFPDDPMYDKQWNLREIGAPVAWQQTPRGRGILVAVIDTGVTQVEDLGGTSVEKGASFVRGVESSADDQGHGTHVAGTIAQSTNNGIGVAGIAPEASILPVKVLSGSGTGTSAWIAAGIDYAADEGADVINLSLGGSYSLVVHNAIRKARRRGVLIVAAAGNSGRQGVSYPGALKETIGVSATGPGGKLAPYSSWGKGVDLAAPGGDKSQKDGGILQNTVGAGGQGEMYGAFQGTSMATPHVAGAAAVLLSTGLEPDVVERVLLDSARGQGVSPKYGHGVLDLEAALTQTDTMHNMIRFALAFCFTWLIGGLGRTKQRRVLMASVCGALVAGGVFFLDWLPIAQGTWLQLASQGLLEWPAILLGPAWMQFPLWLSSLLPLLATFVLGADQRTRPVALGITCGVGTHLLHGMVVGTLNPSWIPWGLDTLWLAGNATVCLLLALGLAGTDKLERGSGS